MLVWVLLYCPVSPISGLRGDAEIKDVFTQEVYAKNNIPQRAVKDGKRNVWFTDGGYYRIFRREAV